MSVTIMPHDLYWVLGEQKLGPLEFYFAEALKKNGKNVNYINIHSLYPEKWKTFSRYSHRLPRKYDSSIQNKYSAVINNALLEKYKIEKPSYVFIYNDCRILPETIETFKRSGTKVIIFLGDDPNYLYTGKKTFLLTVMFADVVIVPDSGWIDGLKMLDINNFIYSPVGTDTDVFFPLTPNEAQFAKYSSDVMFIGTGYYLNSWGIKRAAVLNELCGLNMKIFGDRLWYEMFPYFPDLSKHFINESLSSSEVNVACSSAKLYPVIVNAGVINGVPTRVFDCIASGIFVLAEYKKDIDELFPEGEVVSFRSKKELREKADYYLRNENEMKEHISKARKTVSEKYTLTLLVKNILEQI
ncbi:MAG TPA: glycosyltransferase [Ignavibacteria bacterium]|nr:glycosyltransferase [Ignavibacteria bacterium]